MNADDRSIGAKLLAGAVEKPMLGIFVGLLLLMAAGFLVALLFVIT